MDFELLFLKLEGGVSEKLPSVHLNLKALWFSLLVCCVISPLSEKEGKTRQCYKCSEIKSAWSIYTELFRFWTTSAAWVLQQDFSFHTQGHHLLDLLHDVVEENEPGFPWKFLWLQQLGQYPGQYVRKEPLPLRTMGAAEIQESVVCFPWGIRVRLK